MVEPVNETVFNLDLNSIAVAKEFAKLASRLSSNVYLTSGPYLVDGKSLLGIFSLDLSKPVTVHLSLRGDDSDAAKEMEQFISKTICR